VLSQLPRDTGHVGWSLCEDDCVVPEETGECEFLFGIVVSPNGDFLGCVGQAKANFLHSRTWSKVVVVLFCSGTFKVVWSILEA
jgi:hypothetical protein